MGDFFTWGPTLTEETSYKVRIQGPKITFGGDPLRRLVGNIDTSGNRLMIMGAEGRDDDYVGTAKKNPTNMNNNNDNNNRFFVRKQGHRTLELNVNEFYRSNVASTSRRYANVNVSQPLHNVDLIPTDIPIIIGTNKDEGMIFIYSVFQTRMPKAVLWFFCGALFRESAAKVLRHYRGAVLKLEQAAREEGERRASEERNRHEYEDRFQREREEEVASFFLNSTAKDPSRGSDLLSRGGERNGDVGGGDGDGGGGGGGGGGDGGASRPRRAHKGDRKMNNSSGNNFEELIDNLRGGQNVNHLDRLPELFSASEMENLINHIRGGGTSR